jgi:hypothetical protein
MSLTNEANCRLLHLGHTQTQTSEFGRNRILELTVDVAIVGVGNFPDMR